MKTSNNKHFFNINVCLVHVIIFTLCYSMHFASSWKTEEANALVRWKNTLSDPYQNLDSWFLNNTQNLCSWTGIRCHNNISCTVLEIQLPSLYLEGHLDHLDFSTFQNLTTFNLYANNFSGSIPNAIGNLSKLTYLDLSFNSLEGNIPSQIGNLRKLIYLQLDGNFLIGCLPFSMSNLTRLEVLSIRQNNLSGNIPPLFFTNWARLNTLNHVKNNFTGKLPSELGFTTIDLSCNNLLGNIPFSLENLNSLRYLNLSHNNLSGHIPTSLGNMVAVETLDLSSNVLTGDIPWQLTNLRYLSVFNISFNSLVGPVPQSVYQFGTFDNSSYIGNPDLCGFPLSKICKGDKEQPRRG